LKSISIVIPTFNSAGTLHQCLESIFKQDYSLDKIEVIVVDGGSVDKTLDIARSFKVKVFKNFLRTGEAGKSIGLIESKGELVAFIDSDNVLPNSSWLKAMTSCFDNKDVIGAEPYAFSYRKHDSFINRYTALFGVCDPLQLYVSNRNRWSWVKLNWTDDTSQEIVDVGTYYLIKLKRGAKIPTIGANGFIGRREVLLKADYKPYYFDIDVIYELTQMGFNKIAMIRIGIVHLYADNVTTFIRKTYRRIRDYLYFRKYRKYPWRTNTKEIAKFAFFTLTLLPLIKEAIKGYKIKVDTAWFFHPFACLLLLLTYGFTYFLFEGTHC